MKRISKNILFSLVIPASVYIIFKILSLTIGDKGFAVGSDIRTIIYTAIYTGMISLAMAINLRSGRIDFSAGAVLVLSSIIGGNIANNNGFGPLGLILSIAVVGMILGFISGIVYVLMKLPPIITSIGLAMIYEAISLIMFESKGIRMIGKFQVLVFAQQKYLFIILAVVIAVYTYMLYFTKFGYNYRALSGGQKISIEMGINENKNAVICYTIAGALLGIAGTIFLSKYGYVSPEAGLTSSSYFMGAFLPIFIGGFIGKYSNIVVGIIIGAFTQAMLSSGLVSIGASNSTQTLINGLCVMGFLIFTTNSYKIQLKKMYREKLKKAQAAAK